MTADTTPSWNDEVKVIIQQFILASASPVLQNRCSGMGFSLSGNNISEKLPLENWEAAHADPDIVEFSRWLIKYVSLNQDDLVMAATGGVFNYLSQHGVASSSPDQLKFAYWFGWVLSDRCDAMGKPLSSKLCKLTALIVLDTLLAMKTNNYSVPQDMRKKFDRAISLSKENEFYGQHGIYTSYKIIDKLIGISKMKSSGGWGG